MNRKTIVILAALFAISVVVFYFAPLGDHWSTIFRPATLKLLHLENPYDVPRFYNPPWGLIALIPFALLPERIGHALLSAVSMWCLCYAAYRMGARRWVLVIFVAMPLTVFHGLNVNVDWLVALGFLLPPVFGLPLVMIKPQLAIGIFFFWFIQAFKIGGIRRVLVTFTPVSILLLLSFVIFGNYFARGSELIDHRYGFTAVTAPAAVVLLAASLRLNKPGLAIAASPFIAPYTAPYSVIVAALGLMENPHLAVPAMLGMYVALLDPTVLLVNAPWLFCP